LIGVQLIPPDFLRAGRVIAEIFDRVNKEMFNAHKLAAQIVVKHWKVQLAGPATATHLGKGTGDLQRKVIPRDISSSQAIVTNFSRYARIHEHGGIILPKRGKWLVFQVPSFGASGGLVTNRAKWPWVKVKKVIMPRRPHLAPAIRSAKEPVEKVWVGKVDEALLQSKKILDQIGSTQRRQMSTRIALGVPTRRSR